MIVNKPTIKIYTFKPNKIILKEICAGIEEEGAVYEIAEMQYSDLDTLCYDAANESVLGAGIGISLSDAAMQMRNVSKGRNLFAVKNLSEEQGRILGTNVAKSIKRMPFKKMPIENEKSH
jgi:Dehydratase medium subunit.